MRFQPRALPHPVAPIDPQGQLSLDISGLVTLLLSSVQDLAGDMQELRGQLAVMSLAAAGALQETAAASQATGGPAGAAAGRGLASGAGGGHLQGAASSSSSLSQLLDPGDVDMEGSSCSGADGGEAQQAAGQAAEEEEDGEFAGLSDEAVALWLQQRLEPNNPHMRKKFEVGWAGGQQVGER